MAISITIRPKLHISAELVENTHRISVIRHNQIHYKEYNASEFHHLYRTATEITDAASITKNQNMVALGGRYKNCHSLLKVTLGFRYKN